MVSALMAPIMAYGQVPEADRGVNRLQDDLLDAGVKTGLATGGEETSPETSLENKIAAVINVMLGFLGILAVIMIIYAGFKWMTAGGNEEEVGKAKNVMRSAIIGLGVILAAYVIVSFTINRVSRATLEGTYKYDAANVKKLKHSDCPSGTANKACQEVPHANHCTVLTTYCDHTEFKYKKNCSNENIEPPQGACSYWNN